MYKQLILLLALSLVGAARLSAMEDPVPIPVIEETPSPFPIPRTPNVPQIGCEYDVDLYLLTCCLTYVTGTTHTELENLDTGEYHEDDFVGSGVFYIPFSCSSGYWRITLILENTETYVGFFYL